MSLCAFVVNHSLKPQREASMAFGFFKHMLKYFQDSESEEKPPDKRVGNPTKKSQAGNSEEKLSKNWVESTKGLIPVIDDDADSHPSNPKHVPTSAELEQSNSKQNLPIQATATQENDKPNWDYWPDGPVHCDLDDREVRNSRFLLTHWATSTFGGDRSGKADAQTWEGGKRLTRTCRGVLKCDDCNRTVRPKTENAKLLKQIDEGCECGAHLIHQKCGTRQVIWSWAGGKHFVQEGYHRHDRPPVARATMEEDESFTRLVKQNPTTGPLGLLVGVPTFDGPGEKTADFSEFYAHNPDRVSKKRQLIRNSSSGAAGGDSFITAFADFDRSHAGFIVSEVFGAVTVVSMQTPFMLERSVQPDHIEEPINGLVNDAAHGFWRERNFLLMISSIYSPDLRCWVPALMSYTNGASGSHFMHHFVTLIEEIALQAEGIGLEVEDRLFAGVMDFSEAEHDGFVRAFVIFWQKRTDNTRTVAELREAAETLLRGCKEHFRAGVTRIARMGGIIPVDQQEAFKQRALSLVSVPSKEEFLVCVERLIRDFPAIASWIAWWLRDSHASMLFELQRKMDPAIWDSIPETTNAEEAMHFKLYSACGRDHTFIEGLKSLYAVLLYYQRQYEATVKGIPIRHGNAERWKLVKQDLGRTKAHRGPDVATKKRGQKNDGRPPNTIKELLLKAPAKKKQKEVDDLKKSFRVVKASVTGQPNTPTGTQLSKARESLRMALIKSTLAKSKDSFEPLFPAHVNRYMKKSPPENYANLVDFFRSTLTEVHECTGSDYTLGQHIEVLSQPICRTYLSLKYVKHSLFEGSVTDWFKDLVNVDKVPIDIDACWRAKDGVPLCAGRREDIQDLITSIPVALLLEVREFDTGNFTDPAGRLASFPRWDFPPALVPLTDALADKHGLIYDLIALGLYSPTQQHYVAQYASLPHGDSSNRIFTYDGMRNTGFSVSDPNATVATHLTGLHPEIPDSFTPSFAVYYLRGGPEAQDVFFHHQSIQLKKSHELSITRPHRYQPPKISYVGKLFEPLNPKECSAWLQPAEIARTIEYVTALPPVKKSKVTTPAPFPSLSSSSPESEDSTHNVPVNKSSKRPPTPISEPDSEFNLDCRCGLAGDGNNLPYNPDEGLAVQCFFCKRLRSRTEKKKPVSDRLVVGRGALAQRGEFWYPVHLIQHLNHKDWRIRWWRGCMFETEGGKPGSLDVINEKNLVDSLWSDRTGRRAVRLGRWKHAFEYPSSEDILSDPSSIPHTPDIADILDPHIKVLRTLLTSPEIQKSGIVPAKAWLERQKENIRTAIVPLVGDLSVSQRAKIAHWFDQKVAEDKKIPAQLAGLSEWHDSAERDNVPRGTVQRTQLNVTMFRLARFS
ncbi:hypothetical protein CPB83DRAFT_882745 [Crepidotus variabilis]|uniref:Uncharacterized protein n=1 Tax=Crepidotus variabilis TaxID=179855 RepID=A0A9P6EH55_9AGAR|nr:hypothetical protein CPB83DRAFT_882745 [Crepidotus variabilis]